MSTLSFEGEVARNNQLSEDNCIALFGIFEIYTIAPGGPITTERYAKNPSLVDLSNNPAPGEQACVSTHTNILLLSYCHYNRCHIQHIDVPNSTSAP